MDNKINLADAFTSDKKCSTIFEQLSRELDGVHPTMAVLVLEGLYRIEFDHMRKTHFNPADASKFKNCLRSWRCGSPIRDSYANKCVSEILKCFTVVKVLNVPFFVGNFGQKKILRDYGDDIEDIGVDKHSLLVQCDPDRNNTRFDLNVVKGTWYKVVSGLCSVDSGKNGLVEGVCANGNVSHGVCANGDVLHGGGGRFDNPVGKMRTLSELGIAGLHQGEIIYDDNYDEKKNGKVYVILYAGDNGNMEATFEGMKRPTLTALRKVHGPECLIETIIFVPRPPKFRADHETTKTSDRNEQIKSNVKLNDNKTESSENGQIPNGESSRSEAELLDGIASTEDYAGTANSNTGEDGKVGNLYIGSFNSNNNNGNRCDKRSNDKSGDRCSAESTSNLLPEKKENIENKTSSKCDGDTSFQELDLIGAFTSPEGCKLFYAQLTEALVMMDGTVGLLAMEGLYRLDKAIGKLHDPDVKIGRLPTQVKRKDCLITGVRKYLHKWLCNFPTGSFPRIWWELRRCLVIYKTLQVPLFVDCISSKAKVRVVRDYSPDQLEDINIDKDTDIFHVTHSTEANGISFQNKFKASNRRNAVKGIWFSAQKYTRSIFGSKRFTTKLSLLGITGLYQGEIVYYLDARNVILYATDDPGVDFKGLKKPTQNFLEREVKDLPGNKNRNPRPYTMVAIFIPARFLPPAKDFRNVVTQIEDVKHGPFCMRQRRGEMAFCGELANTNRGRICVPQMYRPPYNYNGFGFSYFVFLRNQNCIIAFNHWMLMTSRLWVSANLKR